MRKISRLFLSGALMLLLLTACAGQQGSPTAVATSVVGQTASPPAITTETAGTETTATEAATAAATETETTTAATSTTETAATSTTQTAGIPVTGQDILLLECQFCIQGMGNAILVIPETATFQMTAGTASSSTSTPAPDTGCKTVDTFGGKQVVLCRGQENTSLTLNICTGDNNCTQKEVKLQACPLTGTPGAAVTDTPGAGVTSTATAGLATVTDTPAGGITTTPLAQPSASASPTP